LAVCVYSLDLAIAWWFGSLINPRASTDRVPRKALIDAGVDPPPPVTAVLCFVDPSWRLFRRPKSFDGVRIESDKSIVKVLGEPVALPSPEIDRLVRILGEALPPK